VWKVGDVLSLEGYVWKVGGVLSLEGHVWKVGGVLSLESHVWKVGGVLLGTLYLRSLFHQYKIRLHHITEIVECCGKLENNSSVILGIPFICNIY
jgi:hypothetical protein